MTSWQALKLAIGKGEETFKAVADYVGVRCHSTVYKWTQPFYGLNSGNENPLEKVRKIISFSLLEHNPPKKAFAPIYYLAEQFGLIVIPIPDHPSPVNEISQELLKTIEEFADLTKESAAALTAESPGGIKITCDEAKRIETEGNEVVRQVAAFIKKIKGTVERE